MTYEEPEGGWPKCPRCKTTMEGPGLTRSRVDNATRICGACGVKEALWAFENPNGSLPDLSNPIPSQRRP